MEEKLLKFWQVIEPRLRIIVWAVYALLLGVVIFIKISERAEVEPFKAGDKAPKALIPEIPSASAINRSLYPAPQTRLASQPVFASLLSDNMFNIKNVMDAAERDKQASEKYMEADKLVRDQKYPEALKKIEEALSINPIFFKAQSLKKEIQQKMAPPPPDKTKPAAGPPGPAKTPPPAGNTPSPPPK